MAKSIQERVRATLAKAEAAAKKAEAIKVNRSNGAKLAAAVRRENRELQLIEGTVMPRNDREARIVMDAEMEMFDELDLF